MLNFNSLNYYRNKIIWVNQEAEPMLNLNYFTKYLFLTSTLFNFHTFIYFRINNRILRDTVTSTVALAIVVGLCWSYKILNRHKVYYDIFFYMISILMTMNFFFSSLDIGNNIIHLIMILCYCAIFITLSFLKTQTINEDIWTFPFHTQSSKKLTISKSKESMSHFFIPWKYLNQSIVTQNFSLVIKDDEVETIGINGLHWNEYVKEDGRYNYSVISTLVSHATDKKCRVNDVRRMIANNSNYFDVYYDILPDTKERTCLRYFKFKHLFSYHYIRSFAKNHPENHISQVRSSTCKKRIYGLLLLWYGFDFYKKTLENIRQESNFEHNLSPLNYDDRIKRMNEFIDKRKESGNRERLRRYLNNVINWYHGKPCTMFITPEYRIRWKKHVDWIIGSSRLIKKYKIISMRPTNEFYISNESEGTTLKGEKVNETVDIHTDATDRITISNINETTLYDRAIFSNEIQVKYDEEVTDMDITENKMCLAGPDRTLLKTERLGSLSSKKSKMNILATCKTCKIEHDFPILDHERENLRRTENTRDLALYKETTEHWVLVTKKLKYTKEYLPKIPYNNSFGVLEIYDSKDVYYPLSDNMPIRLSPDIRDIKKNIEKRKKKIKKKTLENNSRIAQEKFDKHKKTYPKELRRELTPKFRQNYSNYYSRGTNEKNGKRDDPNGNKNYKTAIISCREVVKHNSIHSEFTNLDKTMVNIAYCGYTHDYKKIPHGKFLKLLGVK